MEIIKHFPQVWFTSDLHLSHPFIIHGRVDSNGTLLPGAKVPRPQFSTVEEMNEVIIQRHNEVVHKGDLVYNLGDLALKTTEDVVLDCLKRMNGNLYFIEGNHDQIAKKLNKKYPKLFVWYRQLEAINLGQPYFEGDTQRIVLCHYAMRVWNNSFHGSWMLYGHSHGMLPEIPESLSFDVGVDVPEWNFYPVSIEQVKAKMATKIPAWGAYKESLKGSGRVE